MPLNFLDTAHYKLRCLTGKNPGHEIGTGFADLGEDIDKALYEGKVGVGAWTAPSSFGTGVSDAGGGEPSVAIRSEGSKASARMRGWIALASEVTKGSALLTIPTALRPPTEATYIALPGLTNKAGTYAPIQLAIITATGVLSCSSQNLLTGAEVYLDGLSYPLT